MSRLVAALRREPVRAYLYGLMAGGERGVQRAADILTAEVQRTLQLLGVTSVGELTPDRVRLRPTRF